MLSDEHLRDAAKRLKKTDHSVTLVLYEDENGSMIANELWQFAVSLAQAADRIEAKRVDSGSTGTFLGIDSGCSGEIRYSAVPTQSLWHAFLETLCICAGVQDPVFSSQEISDACVGEEPLFIEVFVQSQCPNCGRAVAMANALAYHLPQVTTWILDAQVHEKRVRELKIMATPTVVVNGVARWAGEIQKDEFLTAMKSDDRDWLETLKSMIHSDALESVVAAVLEYDAAARAVPGLLELEEMSYHMAMLRIVEECVEKDPLGARRLREPLEMLLDHQKANVRGDAVYGLGLLRDPMARKALERASHDGNDDVRETALDALGDLDPESQCPV